MKSTVTPLRVVFLVALMVSGAFSYAQVGINTTTPDGILDVSSSNQGIVLPRVALTATNVLAPVVDPSGGSVKIGTVVYNTATTTTGTNDVVPGIFVWTGSEWFAKFTKKDAALYSQSNYTRPTSSGGFENITGLVGQSFTPKYTGTYKIELSVNYGGGYADDIDSETDVIGQSATFRFTFDGTDYDIPIHSWCVQGSTTYYLIWEQASEIYYEDLTAGTPYSFSLTIDQWDGTGMVSSGNSGNGRGYTGYDVPCTVEFIYIGE